VGSSPTRVFGARSVGVAPQVLGDTPEVYDEALLKVCRREIDMARVVAGSIPALIPERFACSRRGGHPDTAPGGDAGCSYDGPRRVVLPQPETRRGFD
jgi:hypothetical protein